jgi:integrase
VTPARKQQAPTRHVRPFHNPKTAYADHSITNATNRGKLTADDAQLIRDFIAEIKATKGIGVARANKIIFTLVTWRNFLGPFRENTIFDLYRGTEKLREARQYNGAPYKQNTQRDFMLVIKRFFRWLNKKGYSSVPVDEIREIKAPRSDRMTKTAQMMLTEEEIRAMIEACRNSRDRAIVSTLYEGGFRCEEIGRLTWAQIKFDEYGAIVNVDEKTGRPRYIRLVAAKPYLIQWQNDYPFTATPDALVFISFQRLPLQYAAVATQLKKISKRAGIQKKITPHLFRHSRITEMIRKGYNESTVKKTMWGNINTTMFPTYLHLTDEDIDNDVLAMQGITKRDVHRSVAMDAHECRNCHTINAPTYRFCESCGQPLNDEVQMSMERLKHDIEQTAEYRMMLEVIQQKLAAGA